MVSKPHIPASPIARRPVPGWDYWALTLLGAPAATGLVLYVLNAVFSVQESVEVALVGFAACGALLGWLAPSGRALHPAVRVLWSLFGAVLSAAVPVLLFIAALWIACSGGGCFS